MNGKPDSVGTSMMKFGCMLTIAAPFLLLILVLVGTLFAQFWPVIGLAIFIGLCVWGFTNMDKVPPEDT